MNIPKEACSSKHLHSTGSPPPARILLIIMAYQKILILPLVRSMLQQVIHYHEIYLSSEYMLK